MEFSIVAESGIIEEAYKAANRKVVCYPLAKISVNYLFVTGLFKLPTLSDNYPWFTASDLTMSLVRFELAFWLFNWISGPNEENDRYSIIS